MLQNSLKVTIMRGGTSKGVFVQEKDLPEGNDRDPFILDLFGSPDPMQIDGLGGSHSHTSKLMVVSPSCRPNCDIDYLFAQVGTDTPVVDCRGNCGNLTAAVGAYAIDEGLVAPVEGVTVVRMFNKNTNSIIHAHVPVQSGVSEVEGDLVLPGVLRPGAEIVTEYLQPAGSVFGVLFPTGNAVDQVKVPGLGQLDVSFVDVTSPYIFVRAGDLGLKGDINPQVVNDNDDLLARLELVRGICAQRLGLVKDPAEAVLTSPSIPRLVLCEAPREYRTSNGRSIHRSEVDLLARAMSMQKMHHAYPVTGALCTAAAAQLAKTIPNELVQSPHRSEIRIGHPKGIAKGKATVTQDEGVLTVRSATISLTARRLIAGEAYYH